MTRVYRMIWVLIGLLGLACQSGYNKGTVAKAGTVESIHESEPREPMGQQCSNSTWSQTSVDVDPSCGPLNSNFSGVTEWSSKIPGEVENNSLGCKPK